MEDFEVGGHIAGPILGAVLKPALRQPVPVLAA
jgi:hypothetical protein